jgi:deoxyribodipyrimidine photo-lyase
VRCRGPTLHRPVLWSGQKAARRGPAADQRRLHLGPEQPVTAHDERAVATRQAGGKTVANRLSCEVVQVESDVVVPVETVSDKAEYAARTISPKINREVDRFLVPLDLSTDARHRDGSTRSSD